MASPLSSEVGKGTEGYLVKAPSQGVLYPEAAQGYGWDLRSDIMCTSADAGEHGW